MSTKTIEDLPSEIEHNGRKCYLYCTYNPVFDKKDGRYLHHEYVISYVSIGKIVIQIKHKYLENAVEKTINEMKKWYEME